MAENNQQNPGQGANSQADPAATSNPPGQQVQQSQQEPTWLQHLPEQFRDDAKKSYMLEADYRKKTMEYGDQKKAWETEKADYEKRVAEYNNFAQQYNPFYQKLQQHWDKIGPILAGQQLPQQQPQPQQAEADHRWDNYDVLPPQEQVKRLLDATRDQYVKEVQALEQRFGQALAQREQYYQNFLNVYTDAFNRKFQNPQLDMNAYMKKAIDIQYGRENPMDLAYAAITNPAQLKALQEEYYKKGREDQVQEYQNSQQTNGALQNQTIPLFKQTPLTRDQVTEAARQTAIKKGIAW